MLKRVKKSTYLILSLIILAFLLRIINFSFPSFTSDEARISYRAFTISHFGKDELGRNWPFIFNSLADYQLPVTSYTTAAGIFLFGKGDFGARIIFILFGVGVVFLGYKIGKVLSINKAFPLYMALVLAFSPVLIFLSKTPNDTILLLFLTELIFYLQIANKNRLLIILTLFFGLLVSKFAWFVMLPFLIFTLLFYQNNLSQKKKIKFIFVCIILTISMALLFIKIPQFQRSILENNLLFFSDTSIQPAVNRLRGQGVESGWPNYLEKLIFNKLHFPTISVLHWLSTLSPHFYFGQFDKNGVWGFSQMGAFAKVLIVPFTAGLIYLLKKGKKSEKLILAYLIILTFPALFSYPTYPYVLMTLTIPFLALIISYGLLQFKRIFIILFAVGVVVEVGLNLLYISPEIKNSNILRPNFSKEITKDIYNFSKSQKVAVSDNIVEQDIIPFIEWYELKGMPQVPLDVDYPYKFRQFALENIKIIGSDVTLSTCKYNDYPKVFLSKRDIERMRELNIKVDKVYKDSLNNDVVFTLERGLCIR